MSTLYRNSICFPILLSLLVFSLQISGKHTQLAFSPISCSVVRRPRILQIFALVHKQGSQCLSSKLFIFSRTRWLSTILSEKSDWAIPLPASYWEAQEREEYEDLDRDKIHQERIQRRISHEDYNDNRDLGTDQISPAASTLFPRQFTVPQMVMPVPIKVMVFLDGTWLFYSFYGRGSTRCPIIRRYGSGWDNSYSVSWGGILELIQREVALHLPGRLIDICRGLVFGSVRQGTSPLSPRMKMFKELEACGYEVNLLSHQGDQEKCVDISLAVDMMHYATVDDAYDVGVLVTGDKDFMPAMSRIRDKGKRMVLATMRNRL